jgi:hypothetical protein
MDDGDLEPSLIVPVADSEADCFGELEVEPLWRDGKGSRLDRKGWPSRYSTKMNTKTHSELALAMGSQTFSCVGFVSKSKLR